ncbi:hypothetical protein VTK56DRAFT_6324 [Thermocarpiscus australiensis]
MEALVTRSAAACCCRAVGSRPSLNRLLLKTTPPGARQKSSAARTKRALNIPPHESFLSPLGTDGAARPATDHIIFNPPASAPSVFHTPFKFLPKTDPRRRANLAAELTSSSATIQYTNAASSSPTASPSPDPTSSPPPTTTPTSTTAPTPPVEAFPAVGRVEPERKSHHLTKEDIEEMRRLRQADPVANSVQSLSQRFRCSKLFVMMCCQAPAEHKKKVAEREEAVKARWGPRRRAAREERRRRMAMLFRGGVIKKKKKKREMTAVQWWVGWVGGSRMTGHAINSRPPPYFSPLYGSNEGRGLFLSLAAWARLRVWRSQRRQHGAAILRRLVAGEKSDITRFCQVC